MPSSLELPKGLFRRSAQRWSRKCRAGFARRRGKRFLALNWMAGKHDFLHGTEEAPDLPQAEVLQRIHLWPPGAAQRKIRLSATWYSSSLSRVSLATSLHGLPQAEELLPDNIRRYLQGEELMLKDGSLKMLPVHTGTHYKEFIKKLDSIGMLQHTQKPTNEVEIFPHIFVWGSCFWFCIPGAASSFSSSSCRLPHTRALTLTIQNLTYDNFTYNNFTHTNLTYNNFTYNDFTHTQT